MSKRPAILLLLTTTMLGIGLRLPNLTARSIWFDEAFSWRLIQFPVGEMLQRAAADVHPPLYYLLLKAWTAVFFRSLLSLRLFSVAWAAASIMVSYLLLGEALRSRRAGLLGAALIALSGFQIQYAWEARMYTLGITLALLSTWLLLKATRSPRLAWWLAYALTAAAFAYTHYFALFTLIAHGIFVLGLLVLRTRWRLGEMLLLRSTWYALLSAGLIVALYLPWAPQAFAQNARVQSDFWVPPPTGWSAPDTFYRMLLPTAQAPAHRGGGALVSALPLAVSVIALVAVARAQSPDGRDGRVLLVASVIVPFLAAMLISLLGRSLYQDRFFAFAQPFLVLSLAAGSLIMRPRQWRPIVAAALLAGFFFATYRYWRELDVEHRPGVRAAAHFIAQQRAPDEPVVASSSFIFFPLDFYLTETHAARDATKLYAASASALHFAGAPILVPDDLAPADFWRETPAASFWIVDTTGFGAQPLTPGAPWQPVSVASYPEVFPYQGTVTATRFSRPR